MTNIIWAIFLCMLALTFISYTIFMFGVIMFYKRPRPYKPMK